MNLRFKVVITKFIYENIINCNKRYRYDNGESRIGHLN